VFFRSGYGFDQGFDVNHALGWVKSWTKPLEIIRSRSSERPLFLFLHTYMVHAPYRFDSRFLEDSRDRGRSRFEGQEITSETINAYLDGELDLSDADKRYINALYDAGVARMDDVAGGFLEELEAALGGQAALVFLTSDHGEEFWEHNRMGHGHSLHNELLRVPLLVRFPEPRVERVSSAPVSLLDIVPTVLDYAGLQAPRTLPGRSLRNPIPEPRLRVAENDTEHRALQLGAWKLIRGAQALARWKPDPVALFHLADDAAELDNLAASQPDRVRELDQSWEQYLERYPVTLDEPKPAEVDPEGVKSLRNLGYVR
jgi:arylsulfatase A-like enzyme